MTPLSYHPSVPDFLAELAAAPPMERLRDVGMNCGCQYTSFPRFLACTPYSRFEHSLGVGLIVWHFTGDAAQAAAGLLHDVSTPAFAHAVDFLNGDHLRQESTEAGTEAAIAGSPALQAALGRHGLATADVADYHRFPIADNDTPRLSADRLEYTLGNLLHYGLAAPAELERFYGNLTVGENEDGAPELTFRTRSAAAAFTLAALRCARIYVADEDRFAMQALANLLGLALSRGVLRQEDLSGTESSVIRLLEADAVCAPLWKAFRGYHRVFVRKTRPTSGNWLRVPAKLRFIDPLAAGYGRVSSWDPEVRDALDAFRQTTFDHWIGPSET